ncbi:hypothetical protein BDF14DRAFT_1744473 [Spinellus fusiger]|nr:hypothetical protein BDF14DRAFT_1744473 [Spinellus fusiger]
MLHLPCLTTPVTPPYDYQSLPLQDNAVPFVCNNYSKTSISMNYSLNSHKSAFQRLSMSMLSPPLNSNDSEDDEVVTTPVTEPRLFRPMAYKPSSYDQDGHLSVIRPKAIPYRSPAISLDTLQQSALDQSVVFQLTVNPYSPVDQVGGHHEGGMTCVPKVICGESLLTALRKRVAAARHHKNTIYSTKPLKLATRIRIPKTRPMGKADTNSKALESSPEPEPHHTSEVQRRPWLDEITAPFMSSHSPNTLSQPIDRLNCPSSPSHSIDATMNDTTIEHFNENTDEESNHEKDDYKQQIKKYVSDRPTHSSGRPSRVKGPCQACQETSDGCMRKAFDWPFSTPSIFNDKGRSFVYLCNKCGLRYNKSGGSVCRSCRWVFCKEEKRKAMKHIDQMRKSRADGQVDPNEDIEHFVCTPKYWTCGQPWKVGWVLNSNEKESSSDYLL